AAAHLTQHDAARLDRDVARALTNAECRENATPKRHRGDHSSSISERASRSRNGSGVQRPAPGLAFRARFAGLGFGFLAGAGLVRAADDYRRGVALAAPFVAAHDEAAQRLATGLPCAVSHREPPPPQIA